MEKILKELAQEGLHVVLTFFEQDYMGPDRWHLDLSSDGAMAFRMESKAKGLEEVIDLGYRRYKALQQGLFAAQGVLALPAPTHDDDF